MIKYVNTTKEVPEYNRAKSRKVVYLKYLRQWTTSNMQ